MSGNRRQDMQGLLAYLGDDYATDRAAALVYLVDHSGVSKTYQGNGDLCLRGAMSLLTDIIVEGSDFVAAGDVAFIGDAFGIDLSDGPVWMPGVLSRKKQVAARLIEYAG